MKIACNRKNLLAHASALLGKEYSANKCWELLTECLAGLTRTHGHISHDRHAHIARIDRILGNHGVEGGLWDKDGNDLSGNCSMAGVKWDLHYSNTGDSYALTIFYVNSKLMIGDIGSLFEKDL